MPLFQRLLLAFLAVGALVSVPLIAVSLQFNQESARLRTEQSISQQISIIATNFEQEFAVGLQRTLKQINGSEVLLQYLSASSDERIVNARVLETGFLKFQADYEIFSGIYFADASGRLVASVEDQKRTSWQDLDATVGGGKASPTRLNFERLFERIKTTPALLSAGNMEWFMPPRVAIIEGPFRDERGRLSLLAGLPSLDYDSGALSGAAVIRVRLDTFLGRLKDITLFEEQPVWLFDAKGEVLLKPANPALVLKAEDMSGAAAAVEVQLKPVDGGLVAWRDLDVIAGTPFLRLAYAVPGAALQRDFRPALYFFLLVLALSGAVVATIAYFVARKLSLPIIQLAQAAAGMARGDLGQRVDVKSTGELQVLVDSFNQMSFNLLLANQNRSEAFAVLRQTAAQLKTNRTDVALLPSMTAHHDEAEVSAPGQEDAEDLRAVSGLIRELMEEREVNLKGLREAKESAEAANRTKSQFLANVSHEIRTPLNAVLGMLKLLQSTALTARQSDYVTKTEGAARSLLLLLNDVLDFSKAEAEKMTLDPRPFRLDQVLRDLSVILSASIAAKPVEVLFDIDAGLPKCLVGDDLRLQQVLINLGGNAVKFTESGEVVIRVGVVERGQEDVLLEFAVRDTGIGIPKEQQQHIFEGFSQAEASTTRRFGGTGLGLAICQRLVGLMGGHIEVRSEPGRGSEFSFRIRLPLDDKAEPGAQTERADKLPELSHLRALVVDDNATARDVLSSMARSLGWRVEVADSGAKAVEMARRAQERGEAFDVVFVDWQMPGMDGWETSLRLRGATGGGAMVMMVTAHGREMLAQRSATEQAALGGFLVKPVTASMMFDAVADARMATPVHEWMQPVAALAPRRLQGLRLLVVEDNPNNQQVAQELLQAEGATVWLADNGRKGVEAVREAQPPFDAVLMDLQMPVMDGFTAAAAIRGDAATASLPIIAMTANAMASDRQACIDAGMNDHVGKPFDIGDLVRTVLRHTRPQGLHEGAEGEERAGVGVLSEELLAQARGCGVDLAAAVGRLGSRLDVYVRSLRNFLRDLPQATGRVQSLVEQGEWAQAARELHTLKGLAGMLGATAMQAFCAAAEAQFRAGPQPAEAGARLAELLALSASLEIACAPMLGALERQIDEQRADVGLTRQQVQQGLGELRQRLLQSDMGAIDIYDRVRGALGAWPAKSVAALEGAMAVLDFEAAGRACEQLLHEEQTS